MKVVYQIGLGFLMGLLTILFWKGCEESAPVASSVTVTDSTHTDSSYKETLRDVDVPVEPKTFVGVKARVIETYTPQLPKGNDSLQKILDSLLKLPKIYAFADSVERADSSGWDRVRGEFDVERGQMSWLQFTLDPLKAQVKDTDRNTNKDHTRKEASDMIRPTRKPLFTLQAGLSTNLLAVNPLSELTARARLSADLGSVLPFVEPQLSIGKPPMIHGGVDVKIGEL